MLHVSMLQVVITSFDDGFEAPGWLIASVWVRETDCLFDLARLLPILGLGAGAAVYLHGLSDEDNVWVWCPRWEDARARVRAA